MIFPWVEPVISSALKLSSLRTHYGLFQKKIPRGGRRQRIYFSMGGWCEHLSNYMGHWCLKKSDYMGAGVYHKIGY